MNKWQILVTCEGAKAYSKSNRSVFSDDGGLININISWKNERSYIHETMHAFDFFHT